MPKVLRNHPRWRCLAHRPPIRGHLTDPVKLAKKRPLLPSRLQCQRLCKIFDVSLRGWNFDLESGVTRHRADKVLVVVNAARHCVHAPMQPVPVGEPPRSRSRSSGTWIRGDGGQSQPLGRLFGLPPPVVCRVNELKPNSTTPFLPLTRPYHVLRTGRVCGFIWTVEWGLKDCRTPRWDVATLMKFDGDCGASS